MSEALHVIVDGEHVRRTFGMLTGYMLAPDANAVLLTEFAGLPVEERVCLLAATRTMWHIFASDAATLGAYEGSPEQALRESREQTDADYLLTLPSAVSLAHSLDSALSLRGLTHIEPRIVDEIDRRPALALGTLGYFLRAVSTVLLSCATQRRCTVAELLATVGHRLALAA